MLAKKKLEEYKKELRSYADEISKKNFTFDFNGDILFVKGVITETLPKDTTYEIKFNLKKPVIANKGPL